MENPVGLKKLTQHYGYDVAERVEILDHEKVFGQVVAEYALDLNPNEIEIKALDLSANNAAITLEFCRAIKQKKSKKQKITVWANDPSFKSTGELRSLLAYRAEEKILKSGEAGKLIRRPLLAKIAQELKTSDFRGEELDLIWDRLGAMWHTINSQDIEEVRRLLTCVKDLLKVGGVYILDGPAPKMGRGFSTLRKLEILLKNSRLEDDWFKSLGFEPQRVENKGCLLLILKKI